jgi:hypothetical protein
LGIQITECRRAKFEHMGLPSIRQFRDAIWKLLRQIVRFRSIGL